MKAKKLLMVVIVLTAAATGAVTFGSRAQLAYQSFGLFSADAYEETPKSRMPDHVLYDKLFRMVGSLKKKAESVQDITAEKADALSNYFKRRAQLSDEENQILLNTALEFMREAAPVDERARAAISEARRNPLSNRGAAGELTPPLELIDLQEQRNALALLYRDRLKASLGEDAFARFDEFVESDFASGFQVISLSPLNPDEQQRR